MEWNCKVYYHYYRSDAVVVCLFVARLQLIYCGDKCFGRYLMDGEAVVIKRIVWSLINLKAEIVRKIEDKRDEI